MSNPSQEQRIDDALRERLSVVDFGLEAQQFLGSKLGQYLLRRATAEVEAKTKVLKEMDIVGNPVAAQRVQSEIWRAESFMYWIADVIRSGAQMTEQLIAEEKQQALGQGDFTPLEGDVTGA